MPITHHMPCPGCPAPTSLLAQRRGGFRALSRAAARYAGARFRQAGQLPVASDWRARVAICGGCQVRVEVDGIAYCGKPLWQRQFGTAAGPGCGCPIIDKARAPAEHCPLIEPAAVPGQSPCRCKWCSQSQRKARIDR